VKRFAQKYGWSVLPISLDGGTLPEFPNARRDNGMAARLQITHVPALIALHSKTGKLLPLAYGMVSESEIERRIEMLTKLPLFNSQKINQLGDFKK
jgi:conjugal transfer pilus assembly protein TraF